MDLKEFFARSFVLAVMHFMVLGPLIGGFYLLAKTGFTHEAHSGYAILFFIFYLFSSYVSGMIPALVTATVWFSAVCVILCMRMNSLLELPIIFLVGSSAISGLAGYAAELLWERNLILQAGITYSDSAAIAGCVAGFMAANGVLKFAESKNLQHSS